MRLAFFSIFLVLCAASLWGQEPHERLSSEFVQINRQLEQLKSDSRAVKRVRDLVQAIEKTTVERTDNFSHLTVADKQFLQPSVPPMIRVLDDFLSGSYQIPGENAEQFRGQVLQIRGLFMRVSAIYEER